jgi:hypothetical protein
MGAAIFFVVGVLDESTGVTILAEGVKVGIGKTDGESGGSVLVGGLTVAAREAGSFVGVVSLGGGAQAEEVASNKETIQYNQRNLKGLFNFIRPSLWWIFVCFNQIFPGLKGQLRAAFEPALKGEQVLRMGFDRKSRH